MKIFKSESWGNVKALISPLSTSMQATYGHNKNQQAYKTGEKKCVLKRLVAPLAAAPCCVNTKHSNAILKILINVK